jgi:hypothetical protein
MTKKEKNKYTLLQASLMTYGLALVNYEQEMHLGVYLVVLLLSYVFFVFISRFMAERTVYNSVQSKLLGKNNLDRFSLLLAIPVLVLINALKASAFNSMFLQSIVNLVFLVLGFYFYFYNKEIVEKYYYLEVNKNKE